MLNRTASALAFLAIAAFSLAATTADKTTHQPKGVTVHEWGTFTTVAGDDGRAIDWLPLGGPADLPCFVEHYKNQEFKVALTEKPAYYDYDAARAKFSGKVRMETPVLYFYSPVPTTVAVQVRFPRGVMTEWYPTAKVVQPNVGPTTLSDPRAFSTIDWPLVKIAPSAMPVFPRGAGDSHYYAARETDAAAVVVGEQTEKFLFYRGVASFDVPLSAEAQGDGSVRISNLGAESIPNVVLFEHYGGRIGFRAGTALKTAVTMEAPALTSDFATLRTALEQMLVAAGLYAREASAMVETWRDSWFEEGTRVFYVVPAAAVDRILPLTMEPAPAAITRVFVGRMEVMTPMTANAVEAAIAHHDVAALEKFARFLGPIADRYMNSFSSPAQGPRVREATNAAFAAYVSHSSTCR